MDNCLKLLNGKKSIDIFECARVDKETPIETTLKTLEEEYVKTGKLGGIALSEVGAATVERAAKATKIVACEVEVSLWATDIFSNGVAEACAKHGIPVVAYVPIPSNLLLTNNDRYSPIGRGMLSGQIKSPKDIPEADFRRTIPRFNEENFPKNLELVRELEKIAKQKGCTPAQLAISWVRNLSGKNGNPVVIPIPGATSEERVAENAKEIALNDQDIAEIDSILKSFNVAGERYGGPALAHING